METQAYVRGGKQKEIYTKTDVTHWSCPLCDQSDSKWIKTERGVLGVVECRNCRLIRVDPRLERPDEVYRGNGDVYREEFRLVRSGVPHHRDKNYLRDIKLIEKYKPTGNFLDVGTNCGSFLRLARNRGWKLTGVEPSPVLAGLAREWWGLEILEGFLEAVSLPSNHFDVVTMTDVFEHVVNPKQVLAQVRSVIKSDGILFIKVPNGKFNILKHKARRLLGKKNSDDFDSYEHVLHYSQHTLNAMLRSAGFTPMRFTIESPVQLPVWHLHVGHYYQHRSPFTLAWKTYSARNILYWLSYLERTMMREIGHLAPNIGCIARPSAN